jgi:cell division protein FtsN
VCGSFGVQANAESLKEKLDAQGYDAKVVLAPEKNMYRVVVASYDDRAQAAQARDEFKARHTDNSDFQKSWLLYRVY